MDYGKYHRMGTMTRLAEERSRRKAESARYEMQGNPLDDLKAMQEYQNKRQTFQMNQNKMLKSQGDAFALDIYSNLNGLNKDETIAFGIKLGADYPEIKKNKPELFEVNEDNWEAWGKTRIDNATRRLGKEPDEETRTTDQKNYEATLKDPGFLDYLNSKKGKTKFTVGEDGEVTFESGSGLTTGTETKVQKEIVSLETRLNDAKGIGDLIDKDLLTLGGKTKAFYLNTASFLFGKELNPEQQEFVDSSRKLRESVEQVFNAYRKEITGAQAAMKEIRMLRGSILNFKLSPAQMKGSYNNYIELIERQLRLKRQLLREGYSTETDADRKKLGAELDKRYKDGGDVSQEEIQARGNELSNQIELKLRKSGSNLSEEDLTKTVTRDVLKQLKKEGY